MQLYGRAAHHNATRSGYIDREVAWPPHGFSLANGKASRGRDQPGVAKIAAQGGSRRTGSRIFHNAADGERVPRVKQIGPLLPYKLERGQLCIEHDLPKRLEVVVKVRKTISLGGSQHEVPGSGIGPHWRDCSRQVGTFPPKRSEHILKQRVRYRLVPGRDGHQRAFRSSFNGSGRYHHVAGGGREGIAAVTFASTKHNAGGNRRMSTERYLGLGTVVTHDALRALRGCDEHGFRVSDVRRDLLHFRGLRQPFADPDTRWIATLGVVGEGGEIMKYSLAHEEIPV